MPSGRDFLGYGASGLHPHWPQNAHLALQFVLNYEEGGEACIVHGDASSEHLLSDVPGATPLPAQRHLNIESLYEYGSRAGFWRLHRLLTSYDNLPITVFAVGKALEMNPTVIPAMRAAQWEIASHGYRWLDYQNIAPEQEEAHVQQTMHVHAALVGHLPRGFYQGKPSMHTRRIVHRLQSEQRQRGEAVYDSDAYNDDLPYWVPMPQEEDEDDMQYQLVIPYTLCNNDMRMVVPGGFPNGDAFFAYLKDAFDCLYAEGQAGAPKMMSVGLHCRIVGQPGRCMALKRFLDYVKSKERVWICTRQEIAQHWYTHHPPPSQQA